jgi:hypothetical protein
MNELEIVLIDCPVWYKFLDIFKNMVNFKVMSKWPTRENITDDSSIPRIIKKSTETNDSFHLHICQKISSLKSNYNKQNSNHEKPLVINNGFFF